MVYAAMRRLRLYLLLVGICLLSLPFTGNLAAQQMMVPENIQAALLDKILPFAPRLADEATIKLLIVYDPGTRTLAERQAAAMSPRWQVDLVLEQNSATQIQEYDVVYFYKASKPLLEACKEHKVLSVSGNRELAENGSVSLAIGLANDKPRLFVNISSLRAEEHNFSPEVQRIASVTR